MQFSYTRLEWWKTEHTKEDNEDAAHEDEASGLFAVSDGVGEASFSYQWAPILVRRFVDDPIFSDDPFEVEHWVRAAQEEGRKPGGITPAESLSGIAMNLARRGAAATLLGLAIVPRSNDDGSSPAYSYKVAAIGDSNFFHWRGSPDTGYAPPLSFPVRDAREFGTLPDSINSRTFDRDSTRLKILDATTNPTYDLQDNDILMLATDAVAQWILQTLEAGGDPLSDLLVLSKQDDWRDFILGLRAQRKIVNDDSTLLIIRVESVASGPPLKRFDEDPRTAQRTEELMTLITGQANGNAREVKLALAYGDGTQIAPSFRTTESFGDVERWRKTADAYKSVSDAVNVFLRHPERKAQLVSAWEAARSTLIPLPWTQALVSTLRDMGVEAGPPLSTPTDAPQELQQPPQPEEAAQQQSSLGLKPPAPITNVQQPAVLQPPTDTEIAPTTPTGPAQQDITKPTLSGSTAVMMPHSAQTQPSQVIEADQLQAQSNVLDAPISSQEPIEVTQDLLSGDGQAANAGQEPVTSTAMDMAGTTTILSESTLIETTPDEAQDVGTPTEVHEDQPQISIAEEKHEVTPAAPQEDDAVGVEAQDSKLSSTQSESAGSSPSPTERNGLGWPALIIAGVIGLLLGLVLGQFVHLPSFGPTPDTTTPTSTAMPPLPTASSISVETATSPSPPGSNDGATVVGINTGSTEQAAVSQSPTTIEPTAIPTPITPTPPTPISSLTPTPRPEAPPSASAPTSTPMPTVAIETASPSPVTPVATPTFVDIQDKTPTESNHLLPKTRYQISI